MTKQTDANGVACFDGLQPGSYTVHETVPANYHLDSATPNDRSVTVDNTASCTDSPYVGETISFNNIPLTDITVSVDSKEPGGTGSTIDCDAPSRPTVRQDGPGGGAGQRGWLL